MAVGRFVLPRAPCSLSLAPPNCIHCQTCVRPARDIFTSLSGLVASHVVVPLVSATVDALGGLYFALDMPCEFANNQDMLRVRGGVWTGFSPTR